MKQFIYILVFIFLGINSILSQEVKFTAYAEKVVEVGETFRLTFELNAQGTGFKAPDLSNFRYNGPSTSSSSSVKIVNNNVSREFSYSYTYYMQALKPGKFTIGSAEITVDGKTYKTQSLNIEVVGTAQSQGNQQQQQQQNQQPANQASQPVQASGEDLFVRVEVNKKEAFLGEHIIATIKIYSKLGISGFENSKFPTYGGFWTQEIETPNQISLERQNVGGAIYQVGVLKRDLLYPQRTGEIVIDPVELTCIVRKQVRPRSFFDDGVRDFRVETKSPTIKITAKALPGNAPEYFSGAVGSFNMKAEFDKLSTKTNEPLNLKISINGTGNVKLIEPLKITFPPDFETYKPEINVDAKNSLNGSSGSKSFQYLIIPRHAGNFNIPPITFSFFDINSKQYKTLTAGPFDIIVEKGSDAVNTSQFFGTASKKDVASLNFDIRYIKTGNINLIPVGEYFAGSMPFYLSYIISFLLFSLIFFIYRRKAQEASNVMLTKNKKANKISMKRLKQAEVHLKSNDKSKFYDEILKAIWGYLSDKLYLPVAELNKENISDKLVQRNVDSDTNTQLLDLLNTCEFARYAPSTEAGEMGRIYQEAGKMIAKIEQKIK